MLQLQLLLSGRSVRVLKTETPQISRRVKENLEKEDERKKGER
jgi:hypothetical protein